MKEDHDEDTKGSEANVIGDPLSNNDSASAQPYIYEETPTPLPETGNGYPSENYVPSENGFTREALDTGYMLAEAIHDVAEEELSAGWGWFEDSNTEKLSVTTTDSTLTPSTSKPERRRREKRKRKKRGKKKKKVVKTSPGVGGHVECTHVGVKLNAPPL